MLFKTIFQTPEYGCLGLVCDAYLGTCPVKTAYTLSNSLSDLHPLVAVIVYYV